MHHLVGTVRIADGHHRAERHHLAARVPHLEPRDVLRRGAERGIGLDDDLVRAAELVEVVDVHRPQVHLHGLEQVGERDALLFGLLAVHVHVELRNVDLVAAEQAGELGRLIGAPQQRLGGPVQLALAEPGAVLELQLEPSHGPEPLHRWRREHGNEGVLNPGEPPVEGARDGQAVLVLRLPLLERLEGEEDDPGIR